MILQLWVEAFRAVGLSRFGLSVHFVLVQFDELLYEGVFVIEI
jgi:hypothetical protein